MMEDTQLMQTELPNVLGGGGGLANGMSIGISNGSGLISHRPHFHHRYAPYPLHQPHLQFFHSHSKQRHITIGQQAQQSQLTTSSSSSSSSTSSSKSSSTSSSSSSSSSSSVHSHKKPFDIDTTTLMDDDQNQPEGTHITHLYPEILTQIFSKLSVRDRGRAAQVCTAWRDAAYEKVVWKGVEARLHLRQKNKNLFPVLQRRGIRKVQVLSLRRTIKDVISGVPSLETLNLSGCYSITDTNLCSAFNQDLPNLKILNLSLCKQITDTSLNRIAYHLKNLEDLDLGGCSNLTNASLSAIAIQLKKLQRLNLRSCWHITDQGICQLAGLNKEKVSATSGSNTTTNTTATTTTTTTAAAIVDQSLALKYLGLQDCPRLTDESLKYIAEGLPTVDSINLSFCISVTDSGLKHLAKMPNLKELDLRACDNISDIGMSYLVEGPSACTVTCLDVSFCDKIGDQALHHLSQGLFHMHSLSLNHCQITDDGVMRIAKNLLDLETLNIGQCDKVTDKGLQTLAEYLHNLHTIDLYGCTQLSKAGLDAIMKLPKLTRVNFSLSVVR